jgi:hypothetical protein
MIYKLLLAAAVVWHQPSAGARRQPLAVEIGPVVIAPPSGWGESLVIFMLAANELLNWKSPFEREMHPRY